MNTINLLITTIVADDKSVSKNADRYNNAFLPIESFDRFFDLDDCMPENGNS